MDPRLDRLCLAVDSLQGQVRDLRLEVDVLRECLAEVGHVSLERFGARLHHRWFARVWLEHNWTSQSSLKQVIEARELALAVAVNIGLPAISSLGCTARTFRSAMMAVMPSVASLRQLYVCGGRGSNGDVLSSAECFDPVCGQWRRLSPMLKPRVHAAAAAVSGQLYVCGGQDNDVDALLSAERFDLALGKWEPTVPLWEPLAGAAAVSINQRVYVCGGQDGDGVIQRSAWCFDPRTRRWERLPPMLESRVDPVAAAIGGKLYVCGGRAGDGSRLNSVERYDPSEDLWEPLSSMRDRRTIAAGGVLQGVLYICGGELDDMHALSSVEGYHERQWVPLAAMSQPRAGAAAGVLSGKLYVCGGFHGGADSNSLECFDPATGSWELLRQMWTRRASHVAQVL